MFFDQLLKYRAKINKKKFNQRKYAKKLMAFAIAKWRA